MNYKLILKILFLATCLILVLFSTNFLSSKDFKENLNVFLNGLNNQNMKWCPDHVVDYKWLDTSLSQTFSKKWLEAPSKNVAEKFCSLEIEGLDVGSNASKVEFKPLLLISSAEAKTATLEWSPESRLFRVQGLVFKSSILSRELLDETN